MDIALLNFVILFNRGKILIETHTEQLAELDRLIIRTQVVLRFLVCHAIRVMESNSLRLA